jgi:hypothetical protein
MTDDLLKAVEKRSPEENETRYKYFKQKRGLPTPESLSGENPPVLSLEEMEEWEILKEKLGPH